MKKKFTYILIILVAIVTANVSISFANKQDELEDIKNQISDTKDAMGEIEEDLTEAMKQIKTLSSEIEEYEDEIDDLDEEIDKLNKKIEKAEEELEKAEKAYDKQEYLLQGRLVALYEAGETTFLDVLLTSDGITDFISKYYLISEIAEYDTELLTQMEENKKAIAEAKATLETGKKEVETLKQSKEEKANALKASKDKKQSQVNKLSSEEKKLQTKLEKLQKEQKQIQEELNSVANKYQDEIANLGGTGTLQKPVKSGVITATWYYPSGNFHGALDYGVSVGTKVYAAEEGVVIAAGWGGGYGNYVCIQHANGLRTYYAHGNGTFYVSVGKKVARGELIMLSGNTGNSTGPHLHFEVRVSPYNWVYGGGAGDCRRDPRNYL